mmetsp:Transcript_33697/g.104028  ORF Transcript_33697/g.104028 Transcript_33697/m.104028 type:complete len:212 (+) Transcript_33697:208-843(+)
MRTRVSFAGPGRCSRIMSSLMKPVLYFHPSVGRSSVYHTWTRGSLAHSSSSGRSRMSSSVWFAKMSDTVVLSSGSLSTARITCSSGVIPVPPPIIARCLTSSGLPRMVHLPRPRYSKRPVGPRNLSVSTPSFNESMCWDMTPPSGNFGCTPARYTLIMRSTKPLSSSLEIGVYARCTSFPLMFAMTITCWPIGRPSTWSADGRAKRKMRVS